MTKQLVAIPDRRTESPAIVIAVDDSVPMPRATDKERKAAEAKVALKVGKPAKHKPSAAQVAANNVTSGKQLTPRQVADVEADPDAIRAEVLRLTQEAIDKHLPKALKKPKPGIVDAEPETDVILNGDGSDYAESLNEPVHAAPYQGPMLALRQRLKAGVYQKAANGQPSCGDEVAQILGALEPKEVIEACLIALDVANPYTKLNIGQQSMNLRNKLRGQLKKGNIGMGVLREAVEVVMEKRPAPAAE